jgi:4-hydroxy-4-methyl-2-oxoglutarate aldolase
MYDIIKKYEKVCPKLVALYSVFEESASIHESMGMNSRSVMDMDIRPVWPGMRLCGTAFTVQTRLGDNLIVHKALDMLKPGDVLVIATGGNNTTGGLWGAMMTASAKEKGCAGMVTDGAVRDSMLIKELGFPVFSRGLTVKGATKALPGKINHPVMIGGILVNPGDLIFADNDSVVVVPREQAQEVYEKTLARENKEADLLKKIQSGEGTTYNLAGFDAVFAKLGLSEEPD